jgi:hypothetical protein
MRLILWDLLNKTGEFDEVDWNYRPILGVVQQLPFNIIAEAG